MSALLTEVDALRQQLAEKEAMIEQQKREAREKEERKGEVKVGEATGKVNGNIGKFGDVRIRIAKVETLKLQPSEDLKKGDSIRITVEADWTEGRQKKQGEERNGTPKVGEAVGKVTGNIGKASDVRIRIDKVETLSFQSSEDLKKGNSIRVTVKKV